MSTIHSIAVRANACVDLFDSCLGELQNLKEGNEAALLVQNQRGSFKIWAQSVAIFGHPSISFDTRLRNALEDRDLVLDLIDTLFDHIEHREFLDSILHTQYL